MNKRTQSIKQIDTEINSIPDHIVEHIISTTFSFLDNEYGKCIYCKNIRAFCGFSVCKIKHHLEHQCQYYDMNVQKIIKKQYYNIFLQAFLQRGDKCTQKELRINRTIRKKIMYHSAKLYEIEKNIQKYSLEV